MRSSSDPPAKSSDGPVGRFRPVCPRIFAILTQASPPYFEEISEEEYGGLKRKSPIELTTRAKMLHQPQP